MTDRKHLFVLAVRWILGGVFIIAGLPKVLDPSSFAQSIDNYRMLPYIGVMLMAILLPWFEIILGLALITGRYWRGAALWTIALYAVFIIALGSAYIRGLDIYCGCFSATGHTIDLMRIIEDIILLAGAVWIYRQGLKSSLHRQEPFNAESK